MDNQTNQGQQSGQSSLISDDQARNIKDRLVKAFGIADLPEDKQREILSRAGELILKRLFLKILDSLSEEDKNAFDVFLGQKPKPSQEEAISFLEGKISDFHRLMQAEIDGFKEEFKMK